MPIEIRAPFKRRAGSGRGAEEAVAVPDDNLSVPCPGRPGPPIDPFIDLRRHNARQDVASHETAQTRQETNRRIARCVPTQVRRGKGLRPVFRRIERVVYERVRRSSRRTGVHVAHGEHDQDYAFERRPGGASDINSASKPPICSRTSVYQSGLAPGRQREIDAAHDVGAVLGLPIQPHAHAQHVARAPVHQLHDDDLIVPG